MGIREAATVTRFKSDGSAKRGVIKATPGILWGISCSNTNAAAAYLRLYNLATNPATSDTPIAEYAIPGSAAGAGRERAFSIGVAFTTGIAYRIVTNAASDGDTACASNEVIANFEWT